MSYNIFDFKDSVVPIEKSRHGQYNCHHASVVLRASARPRPGLRPLYRRSWCWRVRLQSTTPSVSSAERSSHALNSFLVLVCLGIAQDRFRRRRRQLGTIPRGAMPVLRSRDVGRAHRRLTLERVADARRTAAEMRAARALPPWYGFVFGFYM